MLPVFEVPVNGANTALDLGSFRAEESRACVRRVRPLPPGFGSDMTCHAAQKETSDGRHDQHEHPAPSGDTA